jgi:hypothetical protein
VLPAALVFRLIKPHWNYSVVLDGRLMGKIGVGQVKVLEVGPGAHRLRIRFVLLRRSEEVRMTLKEDEERTFICGTSGIGWPTLREASPDEAAEVAEASAGETPEGGDLSPPS